MTPEEARAYGAAARIAGREDVPGQDPEFASAFAKLVGERKSFEACMDLLREWGHGWRDGWLAGGIPRDKIAKVYGDTRDPASYRSLDAIHKRAARLREEPPAWTLTDE